MITCATCSKETADGLFLRCDHFLCQSCAEKLDFTTVETERGIECPACSILSPKNFIRQEFRHFQMPVQEDGSILLIQSSNSFQRSFAELCDRKYVEAKSLQLDFNSKGLMVSMIFQEMWVCCPEENLILVYSLEGDFKRKQAVAGNFQNPTAVIEGSNNSFICTSRNNGIACVGKTSQQILHPLATTSFSHLCIHKDNLYCLNFSQGKIIVFTLIDQTWVNKMTIHLQDYRFPHENDTICVSQDSIFIGSWFGNCLECYNMDGTKEKTYGLRGKGGPGYLFRPRIIGNDTYGALLVCDCMNGRLQVFNPSREKELWKLTTLQNLKFPHFAVLHGSKEAIWILHDRERTLSQYIPQTYTTI